MVSWPGPVIEHSRCVGAAPLPSSPLTVSSSTRSSANWSRWRCSTSSIDPFLECRSEGTHSVSPNICSTLQDDSDRFHRVVWDILDRERNAIMAKLVVVEMVSLDGVMQGPGGPDEDRSGGFEHGGWAMPYFDEVAGEEAGKSMAETAAFLFGRKTYEIMAAYWPNHPDDDIFSKVLNSLPKYVGVDHPRGAARMGRVHPVEGRRLPRRWPRSRRSSTGTSWSWAAGSWLGP